MPVRPVDYRSAEEVADARKGSEPLGRPLILRRARDRGREGCGCEGNPVDDKRLVAVPGRLWFVAERGQRRERGNDCCGKECSVRHAASCCKFVAWSPTTRSTR